MTDIRVFVLNGINRLAGLQANYVLVKGQDALLIDASCSLASLGEVLSVTGAKLRAILLTHCHFDHCASAKELCALAPLIAHPYTATMLKDGTWKAGLPLPYVADWQPQQTVRDGQLLHLGSFCVQAIHTPGHTADGVCYLVDDTYLASGDVVMNDMVCGATVFPTGDAALLRASGQKLWDTCPPSARILGGHVARFDRADWAEYDSPSTVARARVRNQINQL